MGKTRSASTNTNLYALANALQQVALWAEVVAREKGHTYGIESWGVNYEWAFDRFASWLAELEKLRNPARLPPNHPGRRDPSPLLPSQPLPGLREQLSRIFQLHDSILEAVEVKSRVLDVNDRGVYASSPGPVRVLYVDTEIRKILAEAGSAATQLEGLLATPGADEQTEASSPSTVLRPESWDQLGIGITTGEKYLGFTPCPATGATVSLRGGYPLPLKGNRWRVVLECLAGSPDGRTALKNELLTGLGYLRPSDLSRLIEISERQARYDEGLNSKVEGASRKLPPTMADLARELRQLVSAPGQQPVFEAVSGKGYIAAFTARYLLKREDGTFRFASG
jgi:hypothetical protein